MSEEIDKKLYSHYTSLIGGSMKTRNPVKDQLIISDAKKHLADLVKKRPHTIFEEPEEVFKEPEEEVTEVKETKIIKSKKEK